MTYEKLLREAVHHGIDIYEKNMPPKIKGLYSDNIIWINKYIPTTREKACILAEELGHYHTTVGNILDQSKIENRKQERLARALGYKKLVPLKRIIEAHKAGVSNWYELAEFLGVTEEFLQDAIEYYKSKYGTCRQVDNYLIYFDPLGVLKLF